MARVKLSDEERRKRKRERNRRWRAENLEHAREAARRRYAKHPERAREAKRRFYAAHREKYIASNRRSYENSSVSQFLLCLAHDLGCELCGWHPQLTFEDFACIQFHHIGTKNFLLSLQRGKAGPQNKSWDEIFQEIENTRCLCGRCHPRVHWRLNRGLPVIWKNGNGKTQEEISISRIPVTSSDTQGRQRPPYPH